MKNVMVLIMTGLVLLTSGTYVFYLYGYKEMMLVYIFSFLSIIIGWLLFLMSVASLRNKDKVIAKNVQSSKPRLRGFLSFMLFFGFIFLLIAHYVYLFVLSSNRVEKILTTQPTKITTATVIELKERGGKTGSKQYAVLNYHTDNGDRTAEIKDGYNEFMVGNNLTIKYSIEHPDMFKIVQQP